MRRAALAAAAWLAALSASHAALGPRYGEELTIALPPFGGTDPRAVAMPAERLALGLVHETLVRLDRDGTPLPSLAGAWSASAGGREWNFRLAEPARFHDDTVVTAGAVAVSLRRFLRADSVAAEALADALEGGRVFRSGATSELPGLLAMQNGWLTLRLSRPSGSLLHALASPAAAVCSPLGSGAGPFSPVFEVPGRRLLARAHPGHVRGRPFLDRVLLVARPRDALADAGFVSEGEPSARALLLLALDVSRPPFDSAAARAAVDAVVDRADLARRVLGGVPSFSLSEPQAPAPVRPAPGRLAGEISLSVQEEVPPPASQRLVAWLGSLGLRTEVRVAAAAEVRRAAVHVRLFVFHPEVAEPGLLLREAIALAGADALQPLLDAADAEPDVTRRRALLRDVEQKLLAERALLPLASLPVGIAFPEGTHGLRFDAAARLVVEDAWRAPR